MDSLASPSVFASHKNQQLSPSWCMFEESVSAPFQHEPSELRKISECLFCCINLFLIKKQKQCYRIMASVFQDQSSLQEE